VVIRKTLLGTELTRHNCELMTIIIAYFQYRYNCYFYDLYVEVFIKLGNTPFERFSRHCYIIQSHQI